MFKLNDNYISLIYAKTPEYNTNSMYYTEGYALTKMVIPIRK